MIFLSYAISELFNTMGVSMVGNYELFGFLLLIGIMIVLFLLGLPMQLVLGMAGIMLIVFYGVWGGLFRQFATIVAIAFGVLAATLIYSIFRENIR